jgi:hypothetical protein
MPREVEEDTNAPLAEDYLKQDRPIPGQNFVCLSFISPERILARKTDYFFHRYFQQILHKFNKEFTSEIENIVSKTVKNTVNISQVVQLKKKITNIFKENAVDFAGFNDKVEDFKVAHEEDINKTFDAENNFQTSTRGVKIRGAYDTHREAEVRAKVLQQTDPTFHVYVGQVGCWLAWDPDPDRIENQEYGDDRLNKLVKGQQENMSKKDMFFADQTRKRTTEAKEMNDRLKKKLEAKRKAEAEGQLEKAQVRKEDADNTASALEDVEQNPKNELDNEALDEMLSKGLDDKLNSFNDAEEEDAEEESVKFQVGDNAGPEVSVDDAQEQLEEDDPWLQRKLQESNIH